MSNKRRSRKYVEGIGWVRPKKGFCWTLAGNNVRKTNLPAWGSRKYGEPSVADQMMDRW